MNILLIDTSDNKNVFASATNDEKKYTAKSVGHSSRPDSIVNLIAEVLEMGALNARDIDEIDVRQGPGSYTGLKVGASVANALSFALCKKIKGNKFGMIFEPKYQ